MFTNNCVFAKYFEKYESQKCFESHVFIIKDFRIHLLDKTDTDTVKIWCSNHKNTIANTRCQVKEMANISVH